GRPLVLAELGQHVERAPLLERRDELQVLELDDDVAAEHVGQDAGVGGGGALDGSGQAVGRRQDVLEGDGQVGSAHCSVRMVREETVTSSRTSGSGTTPSPGPSGTIIVPPRESNGVVRSVVK